MPFGPLTLCSLAERGRRQNLEDDKAGLLASVNVELEVLRFQLRLAKDLAALPPNSHGHAVKRLGQVGAQVGGWIESLGKRVPVAPGSATATCGSGLSAEAGARTVPTIVLLSEIGERGA
jgi:hypothetical protein